MPNAIRRCVHLLFPPGHLLLFREMVNYFCLQTNLALPASFLKSIERVTGRLSAHPPRLSQMSGAFRSPVASLQSKPGFEAVLSLLLVGSARGLLSLHSPVYIFVRGLCTASFYSVLSSAWYLLMHTFLSFAASKTADKTRSSSVCI